MFSGLSKHTPYPVNSLKLKKILLEQMNNNKGQSKGHGMQSTSRSSSSGGSSQSETNYSKIVNKVERIKIEDENNGNSPSRTASVTPTNNEPSTIGSNAGITDEDKHNGNNVNKSNEPETRYVLSYFSFIFQFIQCFVALLELKLKLSPSHLRFDNFLHL